MFKKLKLWIILFAMLCMGSTYAQEYAIRDFTFRVGAFTSDSVLVKEGEIPTLMWSINLDTTAAIGFQFSETGTSNWITQGISGLDTVRYSTVLYEATDSLLSAPLEPVTMVGFKGNYSYETGEFWMRLWTSIVMTVESTVKIKFIPYAGRE